MPKQTPQQFAAFQDLCRANQLDPVADVWQQKQSGQWIIGRTGIEKIQGNNNITVSLDVVGFGPDYAGVKATATRTVKPEGAKTLKKLTVESLGSAHPKNCLQISYYLEMAEKRAKSRAILMLMGFYALGIYGEDEADAFQRPADSLPGEVAAEAAPAPPTGNVGGGSPSQSEPPVLHAASSSAAPAASTGSGPASQKLRDELKGLLAYLNSQSSERDAERDGHLASVDGMDKARLTELLAHYQALAPAHASASQKEEIIRLLNHPLITRQEKTKMLLNLNRLSEERATQAIAKLRQAIQDREGPTAVAA